MSPYLRIGHRGAPGLAPENTLASFRRALSLGLDGVELDIHLTRDGTLVVTHDEVTGRTVRPTVSAAGIQPRPVPIRNLTWTELQALDAGAWFGPDFAGERVPRLDEVLDLWLGKGTVFIEIKAGSLYYPGIEVRLVELLQARGWRDQVEISSFDHQALRRVKELASHLPVGVLYVCRPVDTLVLARAVGAEALHPFFRFVTPELIEEAHRAGLRVYTWTVDERSEMEQLVDWGIDGIMTNRPEFLP